MNKVKPKITVSFLNIWHDWMDRSVRIPYEAIAIVLHLLCGFSILGFVMLQILIFPLQFVESVGCMLINSYRDHKCKKTEKKKEETLHKVGFSKKEIAELNMMPTEKAMEKIEKKLTQTEMVMLGITPSNNDPQIGDIYKSKYSNNKNNPFKEGKETYDKIIDKKNGWIQTSFLHKQSDGSLKEGILKNDYEIKDFLKWHVLVEKASKHEIINNGNGFEIVEKKHDAKIAKNKINIEDAEVMEVF